MGASQSTTPVKISFLGPSVNSVCIRALVRYADVPFEEDMVWGKTRTPEYIAKNCAHVAPMIEHPDFSPSKGLVESSAIMQWICNNWAKDVLYPPVKEAARRAIVDSAMSFHGCTLYPTTAKACYPALGYPPSPGDTKHTVDAAGDAVPAALAATLTAAAAADAAKALDEHINVIMTEFVGESGFIGNGSGPSIADIRIVSTFAFFPVIDYKLSSAAQSYNDKVVAALGESFSVPNSEVVGYIASKKTPTAAAEN